MAAQSRAPESFPLYVVLLLYTVAACLVAGGFWLDRQSRVRGPEPTVAAYAAAVERQDLAAALEQLSPSIRERSAPFVEWQLGNRYTILESVIRDTSLLDRLIGSATNPTRVIVTLEIQEAGQTPWRAIEELPMEFNGERWQLLKAPLEMPSP